MANARVPHQEKLVPPQRNRVPLQGQVLVIPPPMMDGDISSALLCLSKSLTAQLQALVTNDQGMKAQANREVRPYIQQNVSTTASHFRDIKRMNPPIISGS